MQAKASDLARAGLTGCPKLMWKTRTVTVATAIRGPTPPFHQLRMGSSVAGNGVQR